MASNEKAVSVPPSPTHEGKGHGSVSSDRVSVEYLIDPAEERAVLRKIDWIILPAMTFVYFFQCEPTCLSHPRGSSPLHCSR